MKICNGFSSQGRPETPAMPLSINPAQWADLRHRGHTFLTPFRDIRNIVPVCRHYKYEGWVSGVVRVTDPLFVVTPQYP